MATEEDRINTGVLLTIGAVLAIATLGVALAITALVRSESDQLVAEKGSTANLRPIQELEQQHQQALEAEPAWFDQAAGQVSVPIARAKQLVLEDIKGDPSKATAIAPAVDAGTPQPAADGGGAAPADAAPATKSGAAGEDAPKQPKAPPKPKAPAPPPPPTE
jgi:hypothetical protein